MENSVLSVNAVTRKTGAQKRSVSDLISPLDGLARHSANFSRQKHLSFESHGERHEIPRYLFLGPAGGDVPIRIGIFAGIHGDEPEGSHAVIQFLKLLDAVPVLAVGYALSVYPVCNPTGFEDDTRHSRAGKDLNREFWKSSSQPEVLQLQAELTSKSFDGIIALHTDDTADGFYGIIRGTTLTRHLIEPALKAAEAFLPRDHRSRIDGFHARHGVLHDCYEGVLSAPPKIKPRPFELILETPKGPPSYLKEYAFVAALKTILTEYRKFIAYAPNL